MTMCRNSIYIASPLGFTLSGKKFLSDLKKIIEKTGFLVLDPWEYFDQDYKKIGENNERLINDSTIILAILDGIDVDSGTASEIGFGYGIGKYCFGLRTDGRKTGENMTGVVVNLQIQYWIEKSGGKIFLSMNELKEYLSQWT